MTAADHAALMDAVRRLEHIGPALRLANAVGRKVNFLKTLAPEKAAKIIDGAVMGAMKVALRAALASLAGRPVRDRDRAHKILVAASGAAGGALGLASLPLELPVSTTVMLRSIADIARAEGEDLRDPEAAMACLEVFALDGRTPGDNVSESGYFAIRGLLARSISEAARYIASRGVIDEAAPALVKLMAQIGTRFGFVVSQKLLAQATPALGAFGGAAINLAFIDHFQSLAKGHFTVRRLERKYGPDHVRSEYERIAKAREPDEIHPPAA
ncbi:EcsC family protein [Rhodoblastus acidophilus]|nr:EcsC family protein [Rhodoblastus acidophilus]